MQFGEFFFDGDKRCIYEAPTEGFEFSIDGNGYRIYTPIDEPSAPKDLIYTTYELWSRSVDYHLANLWNTLIFSIAGGAYRYTDQYSEEKFSLIDLRFLNDWAYVPANYPHNTYLRGNLFPNEASNIDFDVSRITIQGVSPRIFFSDAGERSVEDPDAQRIANENLVYSSFLGAVWVDIINGYDTVGSETEPNGNRERPLKNLQLATQVANERGFDSIQFIGNAVFDIGDNVSNFRLIGQSELKSLFIIQPGADTNGCIIENARIQGTLDGATTVLGCTIDGIHYFNGTMKYCGVTANTVYLAGSTQADIIKCYSLVAGYGTPTFDLGGTGQSLLVRAWEGGLKLVNKTGADGCSIDFGSGQLKIDSTCTNGEIFARGVYLLTDDGTENCVVDTSGKVALEGDINSLSDIASFVWNYVDRELTVPSGMTPEQEAKLNQIIIDIENIECTGGSSANEWVVTI